MNPHFERYDRDLRADFVPPKSTFARIERIEPGGASGLRTVSFDAISKDWITDEQQKGNRFFDLYNLQTLDRAWSDYGKHVFSQAGAPTTNNVTHPLQFAPLSRIEVPLTRWARWDMFGHPMMWPRRVADIENLWYVLDIHQQEKNHTYPALLYYNAFTPPVAVYLSVKRLNPNSKTAVALSKISNLDDLPRIDTATFETELSKIDDAQYLAVYDVGQGNANALLNSSSPALSSSPAMYFDVGCGVYGNMATTPKPLAFCFARDPLIVLSHWDSDHWMGVCLPGMPNQVTGIGLKWIAPCQTITIHHKTFILDVYAKGGSVLIYAPPLNTIGTATLRSPDTRIRFTRGSRAGRNHSGIVLAVEKFIDKDWHSWLLTGDCDYSYSAHLAIKSAVATVVPHHGAKPATSAPAPLAKFVNPENGYVRAVYSFGPGNSHSGIRHPTSDAVNRHITANWDEGGTWVGSPPGDIVPQAVTLATCQHQSPYMRGGCIVGWTAAPQVPVTGCGRCGCNTVLTKA